MKLYYLSGACSLASYISLIEADQKFEAVEVDRVTKKAADGKDYLTINPKGYVPALVLDNGEVLTENVAVLSYIANLDKSRKLAPEPGTPDFYRVLEWLGYINSEIHKNIGPLFRPNTTEDAKSAARELVVRRYDLIDKALGSKPYLTGENFTVADAYLYITLSWRERVGIDITQLPTLTAFYERVPRAAVGAARPQGRRPGPLKMSRMKIYSWNVNGIRAVTRKGTFQEFMAEHKPDILCLQETKAEKGQAEIDLVGYHEYWNSAEKKGLLWHGHFLARGTNQGEQRVS